VYCLSVRLELKQVKHLSGAPFYGRLLALPTNIRPGWKRKASDKHSSLLIKFVNYEQKKFHNIGPCNCFVLLLV